MANILNTGVSGLLASQSAIATTSHNIANANTDGYSRQRVEFESRTPHDEGFGYVGTGVDIGSVQRIQNQFVQDRVEETSTEQSRVDTYYTMVSRIDTMLAEDNSGLQTVQNEFFNAIQDLNTNPTSTAARQAVIDSATNLTDRFNSMQSQFEDLQTETNDRISAAVEDVNTIAANIAQLNQEIMEAGTETPNDLLDQRDNQLSQLSELIEFSKVTQSNGAVTVMVANGMSLVSGNSATPVNISRDPDEPENYQILIGHDEPGQDITSRLTGGTIGGLLEFRDGTLDDAMNQLGRMAVALTDSMNEQHSQGITVGGVSGGDFFTIGEPDYTPNKSNTGDATLDIAIDDASELAASDYQLSYDGSEYTLTRASDGTSISGSGPLMSMDGISVEVSGTANAGDTFLIQPTQNAARQFGVAISNVNDIALASPVRSAASLDNAGSGEITSPVVSDSANTALNDTVEIRFNTPADTFDVVNTATGATLDSAVSYSKGEAISYNGWEVSISGDPAAGDVFTVEYNANGTGNNRNGQAMADLQNAALIDGTSTLQDAYGSFVSQIGSSTRQAQVNSEAMDALMSDAIQQRDSVSGVNLDEEAINLTRFQQSYQASAQVIAAADEMFQTLLAATGGY
ncbi:flagellar hook-associated protein FlgK [Granulosicoccaceae sp. 1_MG-2023]|nr:flagellar hook-associated protein FlgK [Granulosicoccaceae sp. 1_MG-2023]